MLTDNYIKVFLPHISSERRANARYEYKRWVSDLDYQLKKYPDFYKWVTDPDYIKFVIAMKIFNSEVIVPCDGFSMFLGRTRRARLDVTIGRKTYGKREARLLETVVIDFKRICLDANVSSALFRANSTYELLRLMKPE